MKTTIILIAGCVLGAIAGLTAATPASAQYVRVYAPPAVVYAPPAVVYAPPAVVYASPAVGVYVRTYPAYPYGYVYNPRRAYRQAVRYGYAPVPVVVTRGPSDFYGRYTYGYSNAPSGNYQYPVPAPQPAPVVVQPAVPPAPMPTPAIEAIPAPPAELSR